MVSLPRSLDWASSRLTIFCRLSFLGPSESSEFSSPRKLTKTLAATRIENATFRERMDSRELEIQQRDRMIGELEARKNSLTKELDEATRSLAKAEARSKQDGNRLKLLHQEVEMLKRHLVSPSPSFLLGMRADLSLRRSRPRTAPRRRTTKPATLTSRRQRDSSSSKRFSMRTSRKSRSCRSKSLTGEDSSSGTEGARRRSWVWRVETIRTTRASSSGAAWRSSFVGTKQCSKVSPLGSLLRAVRY